MEVFDGLNRKRTSYAARIENFNKYIKKVMQNDLSSSQEIELEIRIGKVESIFKQYEEIQSKIEFMGHSSRADFESTFYEALAIAKDYLCKKNKIKNNVTTSSDKSTQTSDLNPLQLPMIQLPKFNGCYGSWLEFRETFTNLVHSNDLIDDIEKFRYLRASMEDSAAVLIQTVDFSASNYAVAWKLINERYNNKYMLVNHHLSCLLKIKAIEKTSSITLKGFVDQLQKNLRALELLDMPVKHWAILLIYMLTPKLDENTRREWDEYSMSKNKGNSGMTLDEFLQFLRTRTDLIESLEITKNKDSIV